ncbi:MAG: aminotransferase class III-fold pyridoxal phosphate-dependent enzyme [Pseudomonadota bacterium]
MSTGVNWPFRSAPGSPVIERAAGNYLIEPGGRQILDAAGGAIVANVGHGRERVARAIYEASKDTTYVVPPWVTPGRARMVESLERDWLPAHLSRIHVTSGGSEAVESALKLAVMYHAASGRPEKHKILSRTISYHGTTIVAATVSGHPARKAGIAHALHENPKAQTPYPLRCPLGRHHPDAGQYYLDDLRALIEAEGPETIAAFIAEPVSGASGCAITPPDDYWPGVARLCREHDILLINDEVMTGFGRCGRPFGHQLWGIEPDILIGGKGLAGGYAPLGLVATSEAIGQAIEAAGYQVMFHTFGAHPAACAAAAEVLDIMVEEDLITAAERQGEALQSALSERLGQHPHVAEVRGAGLLRGIEVVADRDTLEPFPLEAGVTNCIVQEALDRDVFVYGGGTGEVRDMVLLGPAFTVSDGEIDQIAEALEGAIDATIAAVA